MAEFKNVIDLESVLDAFGGWPRNKFREARLFIFFEILLS